MGRHRKSTRLALWMNGQAVGLWEVDSTGRHHLRYEDAWVGSDLGRPISLSMPLRPALPYSGEVVRNFFENLLPDNRLIRERIQRRFGARSTQAQDLLAEIGRDCAGALAILPEGEQPQGVDRISGVELSNAEIEQTLARVTSDTRHDIHDEFRISIAGAQEKTALLCAGDRWMRPTGATPTTHLFKLPLGVPPSGIDLTQSIENEWLCARILDTYGVPVTLGEIATFGQRKALVVPRFDRQRASDGRWWLRLPQEDFAQVFGVGPDSKYEADGGPGIAAILERLLGSQQPSTDRRDFFRTQVLFWMLAAIDGHAKNFSVFIEARGHFRLTPRYDVLSAYPVLGHGANQLAPEKVKMAMAFWGTNRHYRWREIRRTHLEHTATQCGLGHEVSVLIEELIEQTPIVVRRVEGQLPAGFPESVSAPILQGLERAAEILKR